ncbi:MAG TPA: alpha/beta hydrolase [Gemmatimonadaceae bacterium]|nr:alpha/beta hydrolase [Gemmatimonadaceae bacterium]
MLFLAAWIFIPAPTYFLLTFGVGAPEVSPWIGAGALVGLALASIEYHASAVARIAAMCCVVALSLAATILIRLPSTLRHFNAVVAPLSAEPEIPLRTKPMVVADFFRGIKAGDARVTHGVPFATVNGKTLALEVYQPPTQTAPGRRPVIVQIYGGAWQRGEPTDFANFATWIARAGYVVFAIDYRHAPSARWATQLDDVRSALAWIRDHAADYNGDASNIVLIGRSAGAHLALLAAYTPGLVAARGVISYYGPVDLVDAYQNPPHPDPLRLRSVEETFIGGTPDQMHDQYVAASPLSYVRPGLPPTLLVYGSRDHIVEPRYGAELGRRLAAVGTPVAYLEIPWAEHAFDEVFSGVSSQLALYYTERFLAHVTAP